MSKPVIFGDIAKSATERLRIAIDTYRDRPVFDIRVWYEKAGEFRPSKSGATVAAWHLSEIKAAVDKAHAEAVRQGLIEPPSDGRHP